MKAAIEQEARIIGSLLESDVHPNLVTIFHHGWIISSFNMYFIDMELCNLSLFDYIKCKRENRPLSDFGIEKPSNPVIVGNSCELVESAHNIWTIGAHVARGLQFLHSRNYVHRDLNPKNGMFSLSLLTIVLYHHQTQSWKITDFGITGEATSKRPFNSTLARDPKLSCPRAASRKRYFQQKG